VRRNLPGLLPRSRFRNSELEKIEEEGEEIPPKAIPSARRLNIGPATAPRILCGSRAVIVAAPIILHAESGLAVQAGLMVFDTCA